MRINGSTSDLIPVFQAVRQGSVLSSVLFLPVMDPAEVNVLRFKYQSSGCRSLCTCK